ncbi:MAG: SPFH domain-containing protein [Planctomycetota bacterium]|nr:SPFH domain-containing protein [Planctomycetota bacterium]
MQSRFTRYLLIGIAILIAVGFLFFALTRTVSFHEAAVLSRLGSASEANVRTEPGLMFRMPAPFDTVTVYDTRARLLQMKSETQQTADNRQIVVEAFLTWRVSDPLRFYQRFSGQGDDEASHFSAAARSLQSQFRAAMSEVSTYRLTDLFTTQLGASKLPELEQRVMARLRERSGEGVGLEDWGIEPMLVGINRIVLPQETTKDVFERMKATQNRIARATESSGAATAATIINEAEADAARIRAFAERRAEEIRVRGDREATPFLAQLAEDEALAVFLEQIDFLRSMYGKNATLLLSTDLRGMSVFHPNVLDRLGDNGLPKFSPEDGQADAAPTQSSNRAQAGAAGGSDGE